MKTNRVINPALRKIARFRTDHGGKVGRKTDHVRHGVKIGREIDRINHEVKAGTVTARVHHGKAIGQMVRDGKGTVAHNRLAMANEVPATDRATANAVRNHRAARCQTAT